MKQAPFSGLKQRNAFQGKSWQLIFVVAALFFTTLTASAQSGPTRAQLQDINALGYDYMSGGYRKLLYIPIDTFATADSGSIAFKNGIFWLKKPAQWITWGKPVQLNDSTVVISGDTITIRGTGGGGGSPAGADREIQINGTGAFGAQSGVSVTNQGTIVSDSGRVSLMTFRGDSTIVKKLVFAKSSRRDGATVGFIGFSEEENQYETSTIDNTTYWGIGTPEVGGTHSMFLKMENNWTPFPGATYRQKEFYLQIHYPTGLILRPISWTGSILGNDGTWIQRGNLNSYTDWDGRFNLGGFSRGVGEFTTYHNFSGSGNIKLHVVDSTIATGNTIAAGITITGQISGGSRLNTTAIHGQEIDYNWESAPVFRATAPSVNSSNFNYVFAIPSSNTGHRLIVNKGSGVFDDVAMWIHNDGRTVVGNANNFWPSYKFQAHAGTNSFVFGDWDADNTTILYSGAFSHRLTAGGGGSGMGAGYRFEADNASNTPTTIADIAGVWSGTPTAGAENGDILFRTTRTGTLTEAFRIKANGDVAISGDATVTDEAYDATAWNGSLEVPTKNAIRDKIESITSSNIANTDLTQTANRIYNGNNTTMNFGSFSSLNINSVGTRSSRPTAGLLNFLPSTGSPLTLRAAMAKADNSADSLSLSIAATEYRSLIIAATDATASDNPTIELATNPSLVRIKAAAIHLKTDPAASADSAYAPGSFDATNQTNQVTKVPIQRTLKGSATWDPASIGATSSTTTTLTVTGAALGDPVTVSKTSGAYSNGEVYDAFVSATNTVTIRLQNVSGGTFDITSATFNVIVLKY